MAKIQLKRSNVTEAGKAKEPTSAQMEYGEIAVNYSSQDPTLFIKNSSDEIVKFPATGDGAINVNAGTGLTAVGNNATANQSFGTTRTISVDESWLNTTITDEIGNGQININAGVGLEATGTNATANQTVNSTRTLSVKAADTTITVAAEGISVNESDLDKVPTASEADVAIALKTSRSLWGQQFDGTADVIGAMSEVKSITGQNTSMFIKPGGTTRNLFLGGPNCGDVVISDSTANLVRFYGNGGNDTYRFYKPGTATIYGSLDFSSLSSSRTFKLPNQEGTLALTSQIPTPPTVGDGTITIVQPGVANQTFTVNQTGNKTITLKNDNTIPSVGNGTITIVQPGTSNQTFSVNQSGNTTINLRNDNSTYSVGNGQINVNAGTGLSASGSNATANQGGNTTRTLSVNQTWLTTYIEGVAYNKSTSDGRFLRKDAGAGNQTMSSTGTYTFQGPIVSAGNVTAFSDERLKDDVEVISNALDKVGAIRGVTYRRNDHDSCERHAGVIAQEVEAVLPEVIREHESGYKTVAYGEMVGLLVEAVKELKDEVRRLKEGSY